MALSEGYKMGFGVGTARALDVVNQAANGIFAAFSGHLKPENVKPIEVISEEEASQIWLTRRKEALAKEQENINKAREELNELELRVKQKEQQAAAKDNVPENKKESLELRAIIAATKVAIGAILKARNLSEADLLPENEREFIIYSKTADMMNLTKNHPTDDIFNENALSIIDRIVIKKVEEAKPVQAEVIQPEMQAEQTVNFTDVTDAEIVAPKAPEMPKAVEVPKAPEMPKNFEVPKAPEMPKPKEKSTGTTKVIPGTVAAIEFTELPEDFYKNVLGEDGNTYTYNAALDNNHQYTIIDYPKLDNNAFVEIPNFANLLNQHFMNVDTYRQLKAQGIAYKLIISVTYSLDKGGTVADKEILQRIKQQRLNKGDVYVEFVAKSANNKYKRVCLTYRNTNSNNESNKAIEYADMIAPNKNIRIDQINENYKR